MWYLHFILRILNLGHFPPCADFWVCCVLWFIFSRVLECLLGQWGSSKIEILVNQTIHKISTTCSAKEELKLQGFCNFSNVSPNLYGFIYLIYTVMPRDWGSPSRISAAFLSSYDMCPSYGKNHVLHSCKEKKKKKEWLYSFYWGLALGNGPSLGNVREAGTLFSDTSCGVG